MVPVAVLAVKAGRSTNRMGTRNAPDWRAMPAMTV